MFRRVLWLAVGIAVVVTACSSDDDASSATRLAEPIPAATVPGASLESFAPGPTDRAAVVGIPEGEGLAVYALPGNTNPIVGEIPNTADALSGLGEAFRTPDGMIWWLVRWDTLQGWVIPGVAYLGPELDVTAELLDEADLPITDSLADVALELAEGLDERADATGVVLVASAPTAIVDVMLLNGDDSVLGLRIVVSGDELDGGGFQVTEVRRIDLCARGLTDAGKCL